MFKKASGRIWARGKIDNGDTVGIGAVFDTAVKRSVFRVSGAKHYGKVALRSIGIKLAPNISAYGSLCQIFF